MAVSAGQLFVPGPEDEVVAGALIMRLNSSAPAQAVVQSIIPSAVVTPLGKLDLHRVDVPLAFDTRTLAEQLVRNAQVQYVESLRIRRSTIGPPNDSQFNSQYALQVTKAVQAWSSLPGRYTTASSTLGERVKVAILDTGVDCTHPDFMNSGGTSTNSALGGQISHAQSQALVATTIAAPACAYQDDHGHGTHVAGTVAAATHNNTGVAALGYPLELLIYKVLSKTGSGSDDSIAQAIMAAADAGARVVSLSLGGAGYSQMMQNAVRYAWERDTLVVCAAGNSNSSTLFFPAGANFAVGVAATDSANQRAGFSNFGASVDVAAPGVGVLSTLPVYGGVYGANYGGLSGTSMATPHVSALSGLLAMTTPGVAAMAIAQRLQNSATTTQADGGWNAQLGYGIIDAGAAVRGIAHPASAGAITGQVVDSAGLPVLGASVSVGGNLTFTGGDGLFRFANLTVGGYQVAFSSGGLSGMVSVNVRPGSDTPVQLMLAGLPWGTISGVVSDGGLPVAGVVVQALVDGKVKEHAVTGSSGEYAMRVVAGAYQLRISGLGRLTQTGAPVLVAAGGTTLADLSSTQLGAVSGRVYEAGGAAAAGAEVSVASASAGYGAIADSNGNYATLGVPAGSYTGVAASSLGNLATVTGIGVNNGAPTYQDFNLAPAAFGVAPLYSAAEPGDTVQYLAVMNGVPTTQVNWSIVPALGTITSGGAYTAPSSTSPATVTIEGRLAVAPVVKATATLFFRGKLTLTPASASVLGGAVSTNWRVTLSSAAPAGGVTVLLSSSSSARASVPASVSIAAGTTASASFAVSTSAVSANATETITARLGGMVATSPIVVRAPALTSVSLGASSIVGGRSLTNARVNIEAAAPPGGMTVALTSSDPVAVLSSATAFIPEGLKTSDAFEIETQPVTEPHSVTITASGGGGTPRTAPLAVKPVAVLSFSLSPASMASLASSSAHRINLNNVAYGAGAPVTITVSDPAAALLLANGGDSPSASISIVVPAGQSTANFTVRTFVVNALQNVTLTASLYGSSVSATLGVRPPSVASLTLASTSVVGSVTVNNNRLTMEGVAPEGGFLVALASSHPALVQVPATVMVPAGATQSEVFSITTSAVSATTVVDVTATFGGATKLVKLTLRPHQVSAFSAGASPGAGGISRTATLSIDAAAPAGGLNVAVASSDPALAGFAAGSVAIPAGATSAPVPVTSSAVTAQISVTLTATLNGASRTFVLTLRPPALNALSLSPATLAGSSSSTTSTVTLDGPAPAGGMAVSITSADPSKVTVPAAVTVAAGAASAAVPITTSQVTLQTVVRITAALGAVSKWADLTVRPFAITAFSIGSNPGLGGISRTATVSIDAPAPASGIAITLTSSDPLVVYFPVPLITIPAGATRSASFDIASVPVGQDTAVELTASFGASSRTTVLSLKPAALSLLSLQSTSFVGSTRLTTNRVTLTGPAPPGGALVSISSSTPAVVAPATVLVPAGSSTANFTLDSQQVELSTSARITATLGVTKFVDATVRPFAITAVSVSSNPGVGGAARTVSASLDAPAPAGGLVLTFSTSNSAFSIANGAVTSVAAGASTSAPVALATAPVSVTTAATITATLGQSVRQVVLTLRPPQVLSVSLQLSTVAGGLNLTGNRVTIDGTAPPGGYPVTLFSANPAAAAVPAVALVPEGMTSVLFPIETSAVAAQTSVRIRAVTASVERFADLTVRPAVVTVFTLPSSAKGGTTITTARLTLDAPAPAAGYAVALSSLHPGVTFSLPGAVVVVPAGATVSPYFSIVTPTVSSSTPVTLLATLNGVAKSATLTLTP